MIPKCAAQHFGPWMVDAQWLRQAVEAYRMGMLSAGEVGDGIAPIIVNGTCVIPIMGQMTKGDSSFGGTSTVRVRQAIRDAVADSSVRSILLHIDSPGGTVAGTAELAADVAKANAAKPVYAQIDDMGASAAYWVASQARKVYSNATGMVGSLGTVLYVEDSSGAAEAAGIKVHAVATGAYKATGAEGTEVTPEQLQYLQGIVEGLNAHFKAGVQSGRGLSSAEVNALFDGRVHIAKEAKSIGLIDGVQSLDDTLAMIQGKHAADDAKRASRKARAQVALMDLESR